MTDEVPPYKRRSHKPPSHGRSYRGTYHYWHPITMRPVHRIRYRFWHALWWFMAQREFVPGRPDMILLTTMRNAAYTGYTLLEHCDDWREGRW